MGVGEHCGAQVGYDVFTIAVLRSCGHRSNGVDGRFGRRELDVYLFVYRIFVSAEVGHHIVAANLVAAGDAVGHHAVAVREGELRYRSTAVGHRDVEGVEQSGSRLHRRMRCGQSREVTAGHRHRSQHVGAGRSGEGGSGHVYGMYGHAVGNRASAVVGSGHPYPIVYAAGGRHGGGVAVGAVRRGAKVELSTELVCIATRLHGAAHRSGERKSVTVRADGHLVATTGIGAHIQRRHCLHMYMLALHRGAVEGAMGHGDGDSLVAVGGPLHRDLSGVVATYDRAAVDSPAP